jgi:hypothetical protein
MAADWIKVCKDVPDKPELGIISSLMGISRELAFGYWFRVYAWADSNTADGFIPGYTHKLLSEVTGTPIEFCRLMGSEDVGWIIELAGTNGDRRGILFHNWLLHNGKSAKKRALSARRTGKCRAGNARA